MLVLLAAVIANVALLFVVVRQRREKAAELASTGMLRDPLYKSAMALLVALFGIVGYIMWVHKHAHVPLFLFVLAGGVMVALVFVRRSLKWRYPY